MAPVRPYTGTAPVLPKVQQQQHAVQGQGEELEDQVRRLEALGLSGEGACEVAEQQAAALWGGSAVDIEGSAVRRHMRERSWLGVRRGAGIGGQGIC